MDDFLEVEEAPEQSKNKLLKILEGQTLWEKIAMLEWEENYTYAAITSKPNEYLKKKRSINSLRNELFRMKPAENESTRQWMERCKVINEQ